MTNRPPRAAVLLLTVLACSVCLAADQGASPKFRKITLSKEFFSEGATVGDFNKDNQLDYAAGGLWYEGPDFQKKHEYYKPAPFDGAKGYSNNFIAYTYDFNNDAWVDILIIGFPGQETAWFENPQNKDGHWKRHVAAKMTDNESPTFGDLTGDGKPELIFHTHGQLGWAEPDWKEPTKEWKFRKASARDQRFHKFTHGLGYGDVNGDGKMDLLEARGWWQQPASLEGDPEWKFHPNEFASKGNGGAQMYAYDVDGDGDNDVISSLAAHGYGLAWFENKKEAGSSDIKFERHLILSPEAGKKIQDTQFSQLHALDLYDMDGDGKKDIVTGKRWWAHGPKDDAEPNAAAVVYWFKHTPDGREHKFVPHLIDDDSGVGTQVMACDINGDKKGDVVVGNKKGQFILIQQPQATAAAK